MLPQILIENDCFMTHTFYPGISPKGTLYERINFTVNNSSTHQLSACTIKRGDTPPRDYYQDIGIIIKKANVVFSCERGAATWIDGNGDLEWDRMMGGKKNPTPTEATEAIVRRDGCNEFRLTNYTVIGIFLGEPPYIFGAKQLPNNITIQQFYDNTKHLGLKYFKLVNGELYLTEYDGNDFIRHGRISTKELYTKWKFDLIYNWLKVKVNTRKIKVYILGLFKG